MIKVLVAVLVLLPGNGLWCDLQEHYKKGAIVIKGDAGFGEGNDWEGLFYDSYKDMVVARDGSIFVANSRTHNVFKFDKQGKLLKKIGRRGKGP
ncbi:MAG: 6-bladed beta-propeller, partial [Candidatus Aminicenantes bacterium]